VKNNKPAELRSPESGPNYDRLEELYRANNNAMHIVAIDAIRQRFSVELGEDFSGHIAQEFGLENFTIQDMIAFQKAELPDYMYASETYEEMLKAAEDLGEINSRVRYYGEGPEAELSLTLLYVISANLKSDMSPRRSFGMPEFIDAYLETRYAEIIQQAEPTDEEIVRTLQEDG